MKVTIINNGTTKIVLKPESPADILAVKDLAEKSLNTKHHESTQILTESYPNCLVISEEKKEKDIREPKWIGVYDSFQQNKCIGLIPETSSQNQILNFIESHHNASNCYLGKETTEIKMSETFVVFVENKGDDKHLECEYFINKVEFYKQ